MALTFEMFKKLYARIQKGDFESDRKLAQEYGINRNSIYLIRQRRHRYFQLLDECDLNDEVVAYPAIDDEEKLKYTRCKDCGNLIQEGIPCYICYVRNYKDKKVKKAMEIIEHGKISEDSN